MRAMDNVSHDQAKANGWNIITPLNCEVIGKAVFEDPGLGINIMKSTKRFPVPGGYIYNTSTECHKNDQISVAEALVFVPCAAVDMNGEEVQKVVLPPPNKPEGDNHEEKNEKVETQQGKIGDADGQRSGGKKKPQSKPS